MAGEGNTHYWWRPDVRWVAAILLGNYEVSVNTYHDHPTGWGRDDTSIDVWSPEGRGWDLDVSTGDSIHSYLFSAESPMEIDWIIWQGWIWTAGYGWQEYWDPSDLHFNHLHVTVK